MQRIQIHDRFFRLHIPTDKLESRIMELAGILNRDFSGRRPLFISVLNGSFMFAAHLLKHLDFACEIQFVKVSSYHGTASTGSVSKVLGLTQPVEGREVIILEDIIDSGLTIDFLMRELAVGNPESVHLCCMLVKPDSLKVPLKIDYAGFESGNEFLVGFGLDYDGLGRNLPAIYIAE